MKGQEITPWSIYNNNSNFVDKVQAQTERTHISPKRSCLPSLNNNVQCATSFPSRKKQSQNRDKVIKNRKRQTYNLQNTSNKDEELQLVINQYHSYCNEIDKKLIIDTIRALLLLQQEPLEVKTLEQIKEEQTLIRKEVSEPLLTLELKKINTLPLVSIHKRNQRDSYLFENAHKFKSIIMPQSKNSMAKRMEFLWKHKNRDQR